METAILEKKENILGVLIALENDYVIEPEKWEPSMGSIGVLLRSEHTSIVISKEDLPDMGWDEAIKHHPFDRHEAIEIHNNKEQINKALKLIGGQTIENTWYWTRDEFSSTFAWGYLGSHGFLLNLSKYNSSSVRPVTAF